MTKHKRTRAFTRLLHKYTRLFSRFLRGVVKSSKALIILNTKLLLRIFLGNSHQQRRGGFVLPTTVMLILVVTLVITALVFRTFTRSSQVISERQQQVIYNSATPAIDRAKAKLEYLFRQDTRKPSGVVSDSKLQSLLEAPSSSSESDIYTLPDETRLVGFKDANNNSGIGWYFTQNNTTLTSPNKKTIAYSIIFKKQAKTTGTNTTSFTDSSANKAPYFVVRNGPVNTNNSSKTNCGTTIALSSNEKDWEPITSATLAKTFQVTAFVVDNPDKPNRSVATLELQQDRQADKANKWGAYFRYDLEVFNGPQFNWNGAMHTDSSFFLGSTAFKGYLLSAPVSCVNTSAGDSKITASQYLDNSNNTTFQGQFIAGRLNNQSFVGNSKFDLYNGDGIAPSSSTSTLDVLFKPTPNSDSVTDSFETGATQPDSLALDPVALFTQDKFQARGTDKKNTSYRDQQWITSSFFQKKRIFNEEATPPYLDDTYRADNRYGPGPTYNSQIKIPAGNKIGENIPTTDSNYSALTRDIPLDPTSPEDLGLDGYWERRAVRGGLRLIVGQRLELSNPLGTATNLPTGREDEFLQRRTQRDNVAAVQATAVYHYKSGSGTTPVACLATTVHPGTAETLKRSSTFETMNFKANVGGTPLVNDFFTGRGTNGWEFSIPNNVITNTALVNARLNLAYFAGDPYGAFPAYQDTASSPAVSLVGSTTHPYFELTKYGDFSNLRRAISNSGIPNPLNLGSSISDQSYVDTANCLLGMLAYNINYLNSYDYSQNWGAASTQLLDDLNGALASKASGVSANQPDQAIKALNDNITDSDPTYGSIKNKLIQLARLIATKEQVKLDRINKTGYICSNITTFNASATALDKLCASDVKYDALYYIFPMLPHADELRRSDQYINAVNNLLPTTGAPYIYKAVTDLDLTSISISPNTGVWNIPRTEVTSSIGTIPGQPGSLPNSNTPNLNNLVEYVDASNNTKYYQVAFKDAALFNGREMMNVRTLDIDLNLLRNTSAPGSDTWLPINDNTATNTNASPPNGLVYAFREDAVREDGIARPAIPTGTTTMDARPTSAKDPDISTVNPTNNGITTKPVDYFPDPDRRPYGFRLKNGSSINRGNSSAGMSFVSDNPVYIQGDFNLHSTDGTNNTSSLVEEFKGNSPDGKLLNDWSNFYNRTTKDDRFATVPTSTTSGDFWRPTEVLGDAVTILSNNFCDGTIEDGIIYAGSDPLSSTNPPALNIAKYYGCNTAAKWTSYLNQNRPYFAITNNTVFGANKALTNNDWVRENPSDPLSPVQVSVNGTPNYIKSGSTPVEYKVLASGDGNFPDSYLRFANVDGKCSTTLKCLSVATQTRVNATIVQNIIPSQGGQSYGGFHNFPRMIENWDAQNLFLSGAFIQLRFSTQATGSYDQDAWEPSQTPDTQKEYIRYYQPPNRLWGYDVALQYQTAGPVAQRFAVSGTTRSEIYRELSLDDSYVKNLRCAKNTDGNRIDPAATCP
ncbi:MAG: hormogonium polysaccharide biosynthesis protein HpsA [Rhizonema sp. PD37]|nr:hormogonium polysaccharide biosynthesis protein HpsA [Rhizonema sp. PD37]